MMKIVLGALALTAATTPALATETSWSTTDRDLASLSSSLTQGASGVSVSGFLRSSYLNSSDLGDVGGFSMDDAQIWVNGTVGDFSVVLQTEAASTGGLAPQDNNVIGRVGTLGNLSVLDAYAAWNATEMIKIQMGQFRPAFLGSSALNENSLLFINRSSLGASYAFRDQGIQASGAFGMVNVAVYAQNGSDGTTDELAYGFRASATIMGTASTNEGALGASGDPSLTVGLGYRTNDGALADDVQMGIDAAFTMGALSVAAEIVDLDKGATLVIPNSAAVSTDATPFNVTGSFVVMPDQLEAALRFEDFDDADNTTAITVGANWYLQGHAAKWQFNYITTSSDAALTEFDAFQVGLTVSM
jgi:hypothetical protein